MSQIQKIGIMGAGQMGNGIAQAAAQSGFQIYLADLNRELAEKGKSRIADQLRKLVEKGKMPEAQTQTILGAIHPVAGIKEFTACDLVIEAVAEIPELKYTLFQQFD